MQRKIENLRRKLTGLPRIFAAGLALVILAGSLLSMVLTLDVVTVTDSLGEEYTLMTASREPEEIIELVGMSATQDDKIVYTENGDNEANVHIRRAFPVSVLVDGQTITQNLVEGTVGLLLEVSGVTLSEHDYIEYEMDAPLTEGMEIQVYRVTFEEETTRTEVIQEEVDAFKEKYLLENPDAKFRESRNGMYDATFRNRFVNGELESREIISLVAVVQPRDEGSTKFEHGVPVSTIDSFEGVSLNEEGVPTEYSRLISGAVTTAYSSSGGRGASGLGLYCGTVAVNPNVIPYGTRLYITSADNSFVYGYAIATDTGGALMDGRVDIDLYFATNAECLRFGKRHLNVYVLD